MHMKRIFSFAAVLVLGPFLTTSIPVRAEGPPAWAYGTQPQQPAAPGVRNGTQAASRPAPDPTPKHLPGSSLTFTAAQISDRFGPADWYPDDHPAMPDIVAHGRKPDVWACSLCHYPNGKGRPENAGIAGFSTTYFLEQMNEFRNGERKSADPQKKNTNLMIAYAKAMTDAEIKATAEYFSAMKWTPWIRVVETDTVPKTRTSVGMYLPIEGAGNEPIGHRIIETPEKPEATEELRDPRSGFIAYVPRGSINKGEKLVTKGNGKTLACGACHGADLKGLGPVPGLAGRSPSYLVRQLYDMQQGTRHGEWTTLMKSVVQGMTEEDMLNIAAYTASLKP
jgi:cytochrome c553